MQDNDEQTVLQAKSFISTVITKFAESGETDTTEFATNYIHTVLKDVFYSQEFNYKDDIIKVYKYFN